jgi:D-glycero-alpha-D-manno-heptose 1-phosphate guanylyltransferase
MIQDLKAVLLVGGLGTRLRSVVPSAPKVLASVGEISFLELLVEQLRSRGIRRLVLCSGYLADQIETRFQDGTAWGVSFEYSKEEQPLGTAGAIKNAERYLRDTPAFIVMNGDSFLEVDFADLLNFHQSYSATVTLAVTRVEDTSRYGTVQLDSTGRVKGFSEKTGLAVPGLINGGVYVFSQSVFQYIPQGPTSLEKDVFPSLLERGVYAREQHGIFIDIGTPADYARAQQLGNSLRAAANPRLPHSRAGDR